MSATGESLGERVNAAGALQMRSVKDRCLW